MWGKTSPDFSKGSTSRAGRVQATPPTDGGDVRGVELTLGEPPQHARLPDARVAQQEQPEQHIVLFGHDNNRRAWPLLPTSTWCLPLPLHLKPPRIFRLLSGVAATQQSGTHVSPVIMARCLKSSEMTLMLAGWSFRFSLWRYVRIVIAGISFEQWKHQDLHPWRVGVPDGAQPTKINMRWIIKTQNCRSS